VPEARAFCISGLEASEGALPQGYQISEAHTTTTDLSMPLLKKGKGFYLRRISGLFLL